MKKLQRVLSVLLAAALCVAGLPLSAWAGSDVLEAIYYDNNRMESYGYGTNDGILTKDSAGAVRFDVSGGKTLTASATISGIYLVDSATNAERYNLLNAAYGGTNKSQVYSGSSYGLDVYITGLVIPNAVEGEYRLKVVTSGGTYYSEESDYAKATVTIAANGSVISPPSITTAATLPGATRGKAYSITLEATARYNGALTWSVKSGSLPTGLTLSTAGVLSGTPTTAGQYSFTAQVSEAGGGTAERLFSLSVTAPAENTVSFDLNRGLPGAGATLATYDAQTVSVGGSVKMPAAPVRAGYEFLGWTLNSGGATLQPGATVTPTRDVTYAAWWEIKEGVTVSTENLTGSVVGRLTLVGETTTGGEVTLWQRYYDEATDLSNIDTLTVPAYSLLYNTFTALRLYATVDGANQCIAKYDTAALDDSSAGSSVTLTSVLSVLPIDGVTVTGSDGAALTEGTDYYEVRSVTRDDNTTLYLPFLTAASSTHTYTVKLSGWTWNRSESYEKYDWTKTYAVTRSGSKLAVTVEEVLPVVTVTGTVKNGATPVEGVTVTTSQYAKGMTRTVTAVTDADGQYTLGLYANDQDVRFYLYNAGSRWVSITSGATLAASAITGATVTHNIGIDKAQLDITVRPQVTDSEGQQELAARYLKSRLDKAKVWATDKADETLTRTADVAATAPQSSATIVPYSESAGNATLAVALRGESFQAVSQDVTLSGGIGAVTLEPALNPGVVVKLSSQLYANYALAWYDSAGELLGVSPSFGLSSAARDVGSVCPAKQAGQYTVALVAGVSTSGLPTQASGLTDEIAFKTWTVTLTAGEIAELESYRADEITSANAKYVTRPNSTLTAGADSFSAMGELVVFNGAIGLDSGLTGGKLRELFIDPTSFTYQDSRDDVTLTISAISINGKKYDPGKPSDHLDWYNLQFDSDPIDLPCEFTIYATPGTLSLDMEMEINAYVSWDGNTNYYATGLQYVGRASVAKPGSAITTLSRYVNQESVVVSGRAQRYETVALYDTGVQVGSAKADYWGDWTAQLPLVGTKGTEATDHVLSAVTDSGVESNKLVVVHRADGPQLTALNMSWGNYEGSIYRNTIDVRDRYDFRGSMADVTFTAVFTNPDELEALGEAATSFATKALFVVNTSDGDVLYLDGEDKGGGVFEAAIDHTLYCSVESVYVVFQPKITTNFDEDEVLPDDTAALTGELNQLVDAFNEAYDTTYTDWANAQTAGGTQLIAQSLTYDPETDSYTLTGVAEADKADVISRAQARQDAYQENGLVVLGMGTGGETTQTTLSWFNDMSDRKLEEYPDRIVQFTLTRVAANEATIALEREHIGAIAGSHVSATYGTARTDDYVISDWDADTHEGGTYLIDVTLLSDPEHSLYNIMVTALFSADFEGYDIPENLRQTRMVARGAAGRLTLTAGITRLAAGLQTQTLAKAAQQGPHYDGNYNVNLTDTPTPYLNDVWDSVGDNLVQGLSWTGIGGTGLESMSGVLTSCKYAADAKWLRETGGVLGKSAAFFSVIIQGIDDINAILEYLDMNKLMEDMDYQRTQPCFQKLTRSQRQLADDAYDRVQKAKWTYDAWRISVSAVSNGFTAAGTVMTFSGGGVLPGLLMTGGGMAVSHFGGEQVVKMKRQLVETYMKEYSTVRNLMRNTARYYLDSDCKEPDKSKPRAGTPWSETSVNGGTIRHQNDPSGIVYEGVLENPVEGADVTLYYGTKDGTMSAKDETGTNGLQTADDLRDLTPAAAVQTTGEDGRYQWFVPEGQWYVLAQKTGYAAGDSDGDSAATVQVSSAITVAGQTVSHLLPVLPVQLDVNIPLVDSSAPVVTDARFVAGEGVYVTFSKYMMEDDVLDTSKYALTDKNGDAIALSGVTAVERGSTPSNRGTETTYTQEVLLVPTMIPATGSNVKLTVDKSVRSYAGTPMGADYEAAGLMSEKTALDQPFFAGQDSEGTAFTGETDVTKEVIKGSAVTLSLPDGAPEGAKIYYTLDGTDPTGESNVYTGPIVINSGVTVKAVTVASGYENSPASVGKFTVPAVAALVHTVTGTVTASGGTSVEGLTLTLTSEDGNIVRAATVTNGKVTFAVLPEGTYTLSFAGEGRLPARTWTVTVTESDLTLNVSLGGGGGVVVVEEDDDFRFDDVRSENTWYYDAVYYCYDSGYFVGVSETAFAPGMLMDRGMFATVLYNMAGKPAVTGSAPFTDVDTGRYYTGPIAWATENGIISGYGDGTFGPADPVTREQLVFLLWNYHGSPAADAASLAGFRDADQLGAWAREAMAWAVSAGMVSGKGNGILDPKGAATRAEVARVVMNYDTKVE